jgi:hypothetical protein
MLCGLSRFTPSEKSLVQKKRARGPVSGRKKRQQGCSAAKTRTGRAMDPSISLHQNPNASAIGAPPPEPLRRPMPAVKFSPAEIVRHRTAHWRGVQAKTVQIISHEHFEYSFKQQCHLLVAVEQGVRYDGETFVEGLPTSTMRNYSHKLIFVPAGRKFFSAQKPRLLTRSICLYIDPHTVLVDPDLRFAEADLQPRLLFEDSGIWETVLKLKALIGRRARRSIGPRAPTPQWRSSGVEARRPWRACRMAAEARHRFHGRAPCGGHFASRVGRSGAIEPVSFPAIFQAIIRRAAASLLDGATNRTRKGLTGKSARLDYRDRVRDRIQRDERVQRRVSSDHGADTDGLSPRP